MAIYAILLAISCILLAILLIKLIKSKSKKRLNWLFCGIFIFQLFWNFPLLLQNLFAEYLKINPIYFDYIAYIGISFLPMFLYLASQTFTNPKFRIRRYHILLLIVPIISLIILWTNDLHHLFYIDYTLYLNKGYGPYLYIYSFYTYFIILISLVSILKFSFKQNYKVSTQSILFLLAIAIPVIVNIIGMLQIKDLLIYATPTAFSISCIFFYIAIFKFNLLDISSVTTQFIIKAIPDAYVTLNNSNKILSCNKHFTSIFNIQEEHILDKEIFEIKEINNLLSKDDLSISLELIKDTNKKITLEKYFKKTDMYFSIDISPILKNNNYIGTLIFFKDITQKEKDKLKIKENQNLLVEQERLASLGQMIGGIAHNLKTPIFSISGGLEGLSDLIKEYDESIEDSSVTNEDMHEIANDIKEWIRKLKEHVSYMSELITTVKGQAVTMTEEQNILFPISELFQHVNILMQHELKKKLALLKVTNSTLNEMKIKGNINSLVQVINNLISNAIESYNVEELNKIVELSAKYNENTKCIIISVKDYGSGLPQSVQDKLFKEMITTKGKNGTGLGLFMSYSNIKAHFNGEITYETKANKGTTFYISIPIK